MINGAGAARIAITTALCPHCGFDLRADEPIIAGALTLDLRGDVIWQGKSAKLRPASRIMLASIVKAGGRTISVEVLAERIGYEGDNPHSRVRAELCIMRGQLPGIPIANDRGRGVRWSGPLA